MASETPSTVSSLSAGPQTISPTGSVPGAWQGSDNAQPSRKFTGRVLRSSLPLTAKKASSLAIEQQLQQRGD